jgi:hypothetical protein
MSLLILRVWRSARSTLGTRHQTWHRRYIAGAQVPIARDCGAGGEAAQVLRPERRLASLLIRSHGDAPILR